jgi:hypothetical protein
LANRKTAVRMFKQIDAKLDIVSGRIHDLTKRAPSVEDQLLGLRTDIIGLRTGFVRLEHRMDRLDARPIRIERRLDLAEV